MNIPEFRSPRTPVLYERAGKDVTVIDGLLSSQQRPAFYLDVGIFRHVRVADEGNIPYGVLQRRTCRNTVDIPCEDEIDGTGYQREDFFAFPDHIHDLHLSSGSDVTDVALEDGASSEWYRYAVWRQWWQCRFLQDNRHDEDHGHG
jgi:hypothetical protein